MALEHETVPEVTLLNGDLMDLPSLIRAFARAPPDEIHNPVSTEPTLDPAGEVEHHLGNLGAISFVASSCENAPPDLRGHRDGSP